MSSCYTRTTELHVECVFRKNIRDNGKNAIAFLCMLNKHYVIAACVAAYTHRQLIKNTGRNIKILIMCDSMIYSECRDILEKYCDDVVKINLIKYDMSERYEYARKKYNWLQYSTNKWQCLNYEQYDKILFCDVDVLPVDSRFYDIFDMNAPAFNCNFPDKSPLTIKGNEFLLTRGNMNFQSYIDDVHKYIGSADGGLCLFKPSKKEYNDYLNFTDRVFKYGMYSAWRSGPDETSIYYFYFYLLNKPISIIEHVYSIVPWESDVDSCRNALGYNFLSFVKPWIKRREYQWDEEKIWSDIFSHMKPDNKLTQLVNEQIEKQHKIYLRMTPDEKKKYYGRNETDGYGILDIKDIKKIIT